MNTQSTTRQQLSHRPWEIPMYIVQILVCSFLSDSIENMNGSGDTLNSVFEAILDLANGPVLREGVLRQLCKGGIFLVAASSDVRSSASVRSFRNSLTTALHQSLCNITRTEILIRLGSGRIVTDSVTLPYTYASLYLLLSHTAVDDGLRARIVLTRRLGRHTNLPTGEIPNLLVTNALRLRYHVCGFNMTQAQRNLLALRQQRYHPVALEAEAVRKLAEHIIDEYQRLIFIGHANEARFMLLFASRNLQDHSTRYESLSRRSH